MLIAKPNLSEVLPTATLLKEGTSVEPSKINSPSDKLHQAVVHTTAAVRITGEKQEVELVLNALAGAGIFYRTNRTLYPCRDNPRRFNVYLKYLKVPAVLEKADLEGDCTP